MKIRTITSFYDPALPGAGAALKNLSEFTHEAIDQFTQIGLEVQSARLATPSFCTWLPEKEWLAGVREYEGMALDNGYHYLSMGPALPEIMASYEIIPELLADVKNLFLSGKLILSDGSISLPAVRACGRIIAACSSIQPDGFANLRFAALANVPPFGPFLPAAYHKSGSLPACAIGVECADTVLRVFHDAKAFDAGRKELVETFEREAARMQAVVMALCQPRGIEFKGFDFSTAPYPKDWCSLAGALEALGLEKVGLSGSLAAAAFLADTLDRGRWLRTGFNGLFLPVMEDSILALRASQGSLTVRDLLLYSSVCGTGLDTVPLPGDSSAEQISALVLDVAALSSRLNKSLTARLMPIPGKAAGDKIDFDFEFFASSKVMELPAAPLHGLLAGDSHLEIRPRESQN